MTEADKTKQNITRSMCQYFSFAYFLKSDFILTFSEIISCSLLIGTFLQHGITRKRIVTQLSFNVSWSTVCTERSTDGILTTVTFTDGIFFIVLTTEIKLQIVYDFTLAFSGRSIFLYQWHYSKATGTTCSRQFQNHGFAIFQSLFNTNRPEH